MEWKELIQRDLFYLFIIIVLAIGMFAMLNETRRYKAELYNYYTEQIQNFNCQQDSFFKPYPNNISFNITGVCLNESCIQS